MKIQAFDINTWLFPSTNFSVEQRDICLDSVRNADVCFQVLTNLNLPENTDFSYTAEGLEEGISLSVSEIRPVMVSYNSALDHHETKNYDEVKDFVTAKAPFEVFDLVRPIDNGKLLGGRTAFIVRIDVKKDAPVGEHFIRITLKCGAVSSYANVTLKVYNTVLKDAADSDYSMTHWIYPDTVAKIHNVNRFSEEYYAWFEKYLADQLDMRNNYFQLPTAIPVKDEEGRIIDFDFSECDRIAQICLKLGFKVIYGGFVSHFKHWNDPDYYFVWDMDQLIETNEGYRQLKLYFNGVKSFIERNALGDRYMQGLVDEPQVPNSLAYKALCCTFRTIVPGVKILDPIETPNITGSCDIWCVKQAVYDKYKEQFDELIDMGEEFWVYSCGFPAYKWMNHVLDLPLTATRLITWMGVYYGIVGFLHYGYNSFHDGMDTMYETNGPIKFRGETRYFPAGNHGLIYAREDAFFSSVRSNVQRLAAADAELLLRLRRLDKKQCDDLILLCCSDFKTYTPDGALVERVRRLVFEALDRLGA